MSVSASHKAIATYYADLEQYRAAHPARAGAQDGVKAVDAFKEQVPSLAAGLRARVGTPR